MMEESRAPPKFFPDDFKTSAEIILSSTLGLTVDSIVHENCCRVYLKLVKLISSLIGIGVPVCSVLSTTSNTTEPPSDTDTD